MGAVYRATDTTLGRQVAIKVLPEAFAADADRLARFEREAKTLASLNHPRIAAIYGFEKSAGQHALVMELVEGLTLQEVIEQAPGSGLPASGIPRDSATGPEPRAQSQKPGRRGLPLDEALPIARQIAEALEAAHEQGIIHRDLKPANIKVRDDGSVKVLDFGLAKAIEGAPGSGLQAPASASISPTLTSPALMTGAGVILGTAAYMAPEQAKGRAVDKRADIWGFGAVLFEMLTGQRAFAGEDVSDTLANVLKTDPAWELLPADIPARVRQVLRSCLQRDAKQRLGDMQSVRLALDGAFETAAPETPSLATSVESRSRVAWLVAAAAVVGMAALAVPTTRYWRQAPRPADTPVRFSVAAPAGTRLVVGAGAGSPSVAPDGQTLVFGATGADGLAHLFLRRLDATGAQLVTGTDRATSPFWAPDGRSLGFAREGGLYRVALDGSAPRRLCDVPGAGFLGGTWSARGVIVFAAPTGGLQQVPDTGGTPTPVTTLDVAAKEVTHGWPWFLPDGRHVLFLVLAEGQTRGTVWATAIDDPARTRIAESSGGAAYAAGWLLSTTAQPRTLVAQPFDPARLTLLGAPQPIRDQLPAGNTNGRPGFAVSSSGVLIVDRQPPLVSQLMWLDRSGRAVATATPRAVLPDFALAPDERRVVANMRPLDAATRALWLFDGLRPDGTRLSYEGSPMRPLWALDGRHVYFTDRAKEEFSLRTLALGETAPSAFEHPGPFAVFDDVTRDGRYLLFTSVKVPQEVWVQRVGSAERRLLVGGQFSATRPRVSPHNRWLAYTLNLPSGAEVFAQPFDGPGARIQVSARGGFGPVWRDDGRELYYEGPEGLMAVPMTERGGALEAGTPQALFPLHTQGSAPAQPHNFEVAAHGQKFLVNTIVDDSDNRSR